MEIRLAQENDIDSIRKMIEYTCNVSFAPYYPNLFIKNIIAYLNGKTLLDRMNKCHFYVAVLQNNIVGCGAIAGYGKSNVKSVILTFFVHPDYQRKGIGKELMKTLEQDEYFIRAKRIEIPASIPGLPFYKKMGYSHKDGKLHYENGHFSLEKYR